MRVGDTERPGQHRQETGELFTSRYWLRHCEGFRVEIAGDCLGYVEDVEPSQELDLPRSLIVRKLSGTVTHVPAEAVVEIIPHAERAILAPSLADDLDEELRHEARSTASGPDGETAGSG